MSEYIVKIKHDKQNLPVFVIFRNDKVHSPKSVTLSVESAVSQFQIHCKTISKPYSLLFP